MLYITVHSIIIHIFKVVEFIFELGHGRWVVEFIIGTWALGARINNWDMGVRARNTWKVELMIWAWINHCEQTNYVPNTNYWVTYHHCHFVLFVQVGNYAFARTLIIVAVVIKSEVFFGQVCDVVVVPWPYVPHTKLYPQMFNLSLTFESQH